MTTSRETIREGGKGENCVFVGHSGPSYPTTMGCSEGKMYVHVLRLTEAEKDVAHLTTILA